MSLSVLVKSASGLPNVERFSKSDPITICTLQGKLTASIDMVAYIAILIYHFRAGKAN